jgi:predicted Zn-dependent protease
MSDLTRRQCCAGLVALLGGLATGGCATISPEEERQIGRKEAEEVERTMGLVRERRLVEYVGAIGKRLELVARRADLAWEWNVADESEPNAFAAPGGWTYLTRGLLALSNREDEVACVLGHEMAHVMERHAVSRVGAATPLAILFGLPGGILGMVSPTLGGIVSGTGLVVAGLTLARYSREQEHEADRIGITLAAGAGWDPSALTDFLTTLERAQALARGGTGRPSFFATHPSTPERVANVQAVARSLSRPAAAPIAGTRAAFLDRIEGLVIGDNPANGVFAGRLFLHADLDLALEVPAGWKTANSAEAAGAVAPDEAAVVILQHVTTGNDPVAGARADGLSDAQIQRLRRLQISRLPAAALTASTRDGTRVALTWIAHRAHIFRVTGACGGADWERYREVFEQTAASFRPLRLEDRERIVESRLRIRPARAGETVAQVLARGGSAWSPAQAAVANAVAPERQLEPGWPIKVAVSGRYRPAGVPASGQR